MIETTYIQLEKAAEMLGTDANTLLIAAIEGRIKLHGLFGHRIEAIGGDYDCAREPEEKIRVKTLYVTYVAVERSEAIELLKKGCFKPTFFEFTPFCFDESEREQVEYWDIYSKDEDVPDVTIDCILMMRSDIEAIKANACLPDPNTVPSPKTRKSDTTKRNDTLHVIIAALAKQAQINLDDREAASRIEGCVTRLGASISPGTTAGVIKEVLERIPESLERRKKL